MKPIDFVDRNIIFAENQSEYRSLPALKLNTREGEVISCWQLSFKERVKILFTGKVWVNLMMFGKPLTPSLLSVNRKEVYSRPSDSITLKSKLSKIIKWKS